MTAGDAAPTVRDQYASGGKARSHAIWKSTAVCLLLALAVWIVFGQTVRFDFINYDDDAIVYENPAVTRGLDLHEIGRVFTQNSGRDSWFPITDISHMLDWQLYGPHAGGHHLTNVLLHAATAIFLFLVLQEMSRSFWRSAFVAAAFAVHPLRVESVAWVAERKDVLSGLFFMLALWTWIRHVRNQPPPSKPSSVIAVVDPSHWPALYYWALVFFLLGLLSKSMIVTLPVVLLLLDFWPLERFKTFSFLILLLEKWPFFLLSAAGCAVTLLTQRHVVLAVHHFSWPWRLGNALMAYMDYLGHMIYPAGLALLYPRPPGQLPILKLCLSLLVLLGISAGAVLARRKHPYFLAGWLWYLILFLPVIDIMQTGDQSRADRYTYLPQIGLLILIAWGMAELLRSLPFRRIVLACTAGIVLLVLSAVAYVQTGYWKNSISIWTRTLSLWPQSHIAHCNLGIALAYQGNAKAAVEQFDQALRYNPQDAKSINNLGKVLITQGKLDAAIQDFHQALQLEPDNVGALNNLSVALASQGKVNDAVQGLDHALQLNPEDADTCYNLGNIYAAHADYDGATASYEQALQINPDFAEAHCNLGLILARQGKLDQAIEQYESAIQLKPHYLDALNDLGGALAAQGDTSAAADYYQQAIALKPDDPNTLNNLGVILARQSKLDDAVECFNRAIQLNPNDASSYNNLGITLASQGKTAEAIENLQQALVLARAGNNTELEESIRARLQKYQLAPAH
ncbi:MAG TPA: tetratricopeptide repeat protein [Verrucomicrobiae bacterium]|jgi:tetratricopeptide (TPR) repeat protein|nr:tetratricopeptide repeat protein [Verrucomicrobiae bacterium]